MISFAGSLEHLPIVDVMQLLHQARKSGILRVKGRMGESQLVFKDGYMVSANHLNNRIRIGQILVDLNIITPDILDKALQIQGSAGVERKPLIITLLEQRLVKEKDAYKGLEHLIEMAVVEILTWKKGSFSFEVLPSSINDFSFYPGKLRSEINVDTQSVLMDALRIFDEKRRDGELTDEEPADELFAKGASAATPIEVYQCHLAGRANELAMPPEGRLVRRARRQNTRSTAGAEMFAVSPQCGRRKVAPLPVRHTGWVCSALGVALLCYGLNGLASYYGNDWRTILSESRLKPVSRIEVFFRLGFLPWLFTLFSSIFLMVVGRFLLLRDRARREMLVAAWGGVAVCAVYETAEFISWVRMVNSPSFSYCAAGLANSLLMTVLCSLPFLALLWYLQSRAITREFSD